MNEEGAHEEADADEEVERVDEWSTPLWSEGKNKEHAVSRKEDSITSKLKKVKNGGKEGGGVGKETLRTFCHLKESTS